MSDKTRPVCIRLAEQEIEHLTERAMRTSGTATAVARDLIRIGLRHADPEEQAQRLLRIERKLAAQSQDVAALAAQVEQAVRSLKRLDAMFDQLLAALSGQSATGER